MLDYIILALVFAIVIHIFIQTFCNKSPEHLIPSVPQMLPDIAMPVSGNEVSSDNSSNLTLISNNIFPADTKDNLIRDIVTNAKFDSIGNNNVGNVVDDEQNGVNPNDYINSYYEFDNKINQSSSSHQVDAVDKINTLRQEDLLGQKISAIYDNLVSNKVEGFGATVQQMSLQGTLPYDEIDNVHKKNSYLKKVNDSRVYTKYDWKYGDDSVSNGGKFYEDIEGDDSEFEMNIKF